MATSYKTRQLFWLPATPLSSADPRTIVDDTFSLRTGFLQSVGGCSSRAMMYTTRSRSLSVGECCQPTAYVVSPLTDDWAAIRCLFKVYHLIVFGPLAQYRSQAGGQHGTHLSWRVVMDVWYMSSISTESCSDSGAQPVHRMQTVADQERKSRKEY